MDEKLVKLTQGAIKNGYMQVNSFAQNLSSHIWGGKNKSEGAFMKLKINFYDDIFYTDIDGSKKILRKRFGTYMQNKSYAKIQIISKNEITLSFL